MKKVVVCGQSVATAEIASRLIQSRLPLAVMVSAAQPEALCLAALSALSAVCDNPFSKATPKQFATADVLVLTDYAEAGDLTANLAGMRKVINEAMAAGFAGKVIVAMQASELGTYFAQRFSGLPKTAVLGLGTMALTQCFERQIANAFDVPADAVTAYAVGTQQDFALLWSRAFIGATAVMSLLQGEDGAALMAQCTEACTTFAEHVDATVAGRLVERLLAALFGRALIAPVASLYDNEAKPTVYARPVQIDARGVTPAFEVKGSEAENTQLEACLTRLAAQIAAVEAGEKA